MWLAVASNRPTPPRPRRHERNRRAPSAPDDRLRLRSYRYADAGSIHRTRGARGRLGGRAAGRVPPRRPAPPSRPQRRLARGGAALRGGPGGLESDPARARPGGHRAAPTAAPPADAGRRGPAGGDGARAPGRARGPRAAPGASAREQAQSPASAPSAAQRPSDEELGYVRTDDSFLKILADAREELVDGLREKPVTERAADLLDEVAKDAQGRAAEALGRLTPASDP